MSTTSESSRLSWYARRLSRMSPAELAWRGRDKALQALWSARQADGHQPGAQPSAPRDAYRFAAVLPDDTASCVPAAARAAVLTAADRLLRGEWEILGVVRTDLAQPDWFRDPVTGTRAPSDQYAFRINHRDEELTGNIKQVWELSRLQHLTLLATAWFLSHEEPYAQRVASHLQSWWQENPFLSGVHWTSGIEVGIRLISLAWIRRLLQGWAGAPALFEHNDLAIRQIRWHQEYLAAFRSRGSSANNHVIAEAAGQLVASCAFPWFPDSPRWGQASARLLERELLSNTFASGIGRELASDYQCFVAELGILACVEAAAAGCPLSAAVWRRLCAMIDSGAALLDERHRPPRQGDGDDGRGLLLDAPAANRWPSLLALGGALFGRLDWWPETEPDAASSIIPALAACTSGPAGPAGDPAGAVPDPAVLASVTDRPAERPWHFEDAGTTVLRSRCHHGPEIWCRCDGGPHGFGKIAAHAHADALSIEVRYGGVDILADPGTYCYHGDRAWRSYFRSTIAHNTVEVDGQSQSSEAGPFLWVRHANSTVIDVQDIGDAVEWSAEHDGYLALRPPAWHRRCVRLDRASRCLDICDEIGGGVHRVRMAYHLGPDVVVELDQSRAILRWEGDQATGAARLELPASLTWTLHKGETDPIAGWYSSGLGHRVPAFTLLGYGQTAPGEPLSTRLEFVSVSSASDAALDSLRLADGAGFGWQPYEAQAEGR